MDLDECLKMLKVWKLDTAIKEENQKRVDLLDEVGSSGVFPQNVMNAHRHIVHREIQPGRHYLRTCRAAPAKFLSTSRVSAFILLLILGSCP